MDEKEHSEADRILHFELTAFAMRVHLFVLYMHRIVGKNLRAIFGFVYLKKVVLTLITHARQSAAHDMMRYGFRVGTRILLIVRDMWIFI